MEAILGIVILCMILSLILGLIGEIFLSIKEFIVSIFVDTGLVPFVSDNYYALLAVSCFVFATMYFILFKPHDAEKYFIQYKRDKISRTEAITKIADTMYKPGSQMPSAMNSKLTERRINALRKRVRAEESFIKDLKSYIRIKES